MHVRKTQIWFLNIFLIIALVCGLSCDWTVGEEDFKDFAKKVPMPVIQEQLKEFEQLLFVQETLSVPSQNILFKNLSAGNTNQIKNNRTNRIKVLFVAHIQAYLTAFMCFLIILIFQKATVGSQYFIIRFIHNQDGEKA